MEMDTDGILGAGAHIEPNDDDEVAYLPLVDYEGKLLPVPFLMGSEVKIFFLNACTRKWYKGPHHKECLILLRIKLYFTYYTDDI